jgi:hypothetical protein
MAKELSSSSEVLQQALDLDLYSRLLNQLKKDFALANISFDPPDKVPPSDLKTLLRERIYVLLLERFSDYLNLLYIVDVSEKHFARGETKDAIDMAEEACFLILKREWQKVWMKRSFGGGK